VSELTLPATVQADHRRPRLGVAMTLSAACLWAINGAVSKVILVSTGISSLRLTELRATAACAGLALGLLVLARERLRFTRQEVPFLAFYGICGFALVQWLYFVSIEYLPIGIALLIEFTGPVLVALWVRLVWHEPVRRRVWAALALALLGLALVAEVWQGFVLDALGVAAALGAAVALAIYLLVGEKGVVHRDPFSLVCLALFFASVFWAVVQPWWSFPFEDLQGDTSLLGNLSDVTVPVWTLVLWLVTLGTIVPFVLSMASLRHLPAVTVVVIAMFEPVAASVVAWFWLDETLAVAQLVGGAIVLIGIVLAETARFQQRS
jgi:drug/metabolite transporter (DMT)-like permease